jgi:hypothetical protein
MTIDPKALAALAAKMRQLNLPDPKKAAREELETGTPILATYSFLKWLTDEMVRPGDYAWMDHALKHAEAKPALEQVLRRLLAAGADRESLNTLVRIMQFKICDHVCVMLDQVALPGYVPIQDFGVYHVGGGNDPTEDKPIARLEALHEEIAAWDPSQDAEEE